MSSSRTDTLCNGLRALQHFEEHVLPIHSLVSFPIVREQRLKIIRPA